MKSSLRLQILLSILVVLNTLVVVLDFQAAKGLAPYVSTSTFQLEITLLLLIIAPLTGIMLYWFGFRRPGLLVLQFFSAASLAFNSFYHFFAPGSNVFTLPQVATYSLYASTGLSLVILEIGIYFTSLRILLGTFTSPSEATEPEISSGEDVGPRTSLINFLVPV